MAIVPWRHLPPDNFPSTSIYTLSVYEIQTSLVEIGGFASRTNAQRLPRYCPVLPAIGARPQSRTEADCMVCSRLLFLSANPRGAQRRCRRIVLRSRFRPSILTARRIRRARLLRMTTSARFFHGRPPERRRRPTPSRSHTVTLASTPPPCPRRRRLRFPDRKRLRRRSRHPGSGSGIGSGSGVGRGGSGSAGRRTNSRRTETFPPGESSKTSLQPIAYSISFGMEVTPDRGRSPSRDTFPPRRLRTGTTRRRSSS